VVGFEGTGHGDDAEVLAVILLAFLALYWRRLRRRADWKSAVQARLLQLHPVAPVECGGFAQQDQIAL
jgi:hypothetical protein